MNLTKIPAKTKFLRKVLQKTWGLIGLLSICLISSLVSGSISNCAEAASIDSVKYCVSQNLAKRYIETELLETLHDAETAIFNENWPRAMSIAASLTASSDCERSAYAFLIRAGSMQAQMFSREEQDNSEHMSLLIDSAETALEIRLQTATTADSALLLYFIGNCHIYRSLWEAKFGSIITAIKQGLHARDSYQQGLAVDSGFPDLFLGVGAYRYWKSAKSGVLRWSGIISDERQLGIEQVRKAVAGGIISPDGANSALMWILINEKDYHSAVEIAETLSAKYPDGATFLWPMAKCYSQLNKYTLARDAYLRIRATLIDDPGNQINLLKADFALYQLAKKLDDRTTIELVGRGFNIYSKDTPRKTRRLLRDEYRILKRL